MICIENSNNAVNVKKPTHNVSALIAYTPEARRLRLRTLARFIDWPGIVLHFSLQNLIFYCSVTVCF